MTTSLWKNTNYLKFFASYTIGNIGDWFDFFALQIIFAHQFGASPLVISLLLIVYMLPGGLFGIFTGMIADKFNQKWVMFVTDFVSGFLTLGLFFAGNMWLALVLLFIRQSVGCINAPAQQSAVKKLLTEEQLLQASAYNSLVFQACRIIGPLIGALVIVIASARMCLMINAISFWVSACLLLMMTYQKPVAELGSEIVGSLFSQIKQTVQLVTHNRLLIVFVPLSMISFSFLMMGETELVILLKVIEPSQPHLLGYITGVSGIGSVVVGYFLSRQKQINAYGGYLIFAFVAGAIGYAAMGAYHLSEPLIFLYLSAFIQGFAFGTLFVVYGFALKKAIPNHAMGRVAGMMGMAQSIMLMLGSLIGGFLVSIFGVRDAYYLVGVGFVLCVVWAVLAWRRLKLVD